jgi:hypothetical protein
MSSTVTLEQALRDLARVTVVTTTLTHIMAVLLVLLTIVTSVGRWWVGHEVRATHLMLREVLRRTPERGETA